jgi:hypothetical protein
MHQTIQTYKGGGGSYIVDGATKIRLSSKGHKKISIAGHVYWEQLHGVQPPREYDYNQKLEQDKFIRTRDGKRLQVRRRGADGSFTVLPAGEEYFKHHRSLWIPLIPRLIYKDQRVRKSKFTDYVSLDGMPHITAATLRERSGKGTTLEASVEEQRAEAIAAALAHIKTLPTRTIGGKEYYLLFFESEVEHLYDDTESITVSQQHTTFPDDGPPNVETILARPLRGITLDMP